MTKKVEEKKGKKEKNKSIDSIIPEEFKRIEELENKLEEALKNLEKTKKEKKELEEKLIRSSADVQNMKRRTLSEVSKARLAGSVKVITPLITVVDTFKRAFDHLPEDLEKNEFISGLKLIEKNFSESLVSLGVEFFGEKGDDFNANLHESMMMAEGEKGKIVQVFEQGVKMGNEIIRHAKVSVGG